MTADRRSVADLIVVADRVQTMAGEAADADGVAIRDSRILAVGTVGDLRDYVGARTEWLACPGATMVPGLVDGHVHPLLGVDMARGVDLTACADLNHVRTALADAATRAGPADWIRAWGLDPNALGGRPPHRDLVDDVVGGRPALIMVFDGHAALASTAALARAGVTGPGTSRSSAEVVCDADGRPTGHLLEEEAIALVLGAVPPASAAQRRTALAEVLAGMAAAGLTGGRVMDVTEDDLGLYEELDDAGQLPLRLGLTPWCRPSDPPERWTRLIELQRRHGRVWAVRGVKLFLDGTIDGGTAWLEAPDQLGESVRPYWQDPADYTAAVRALAAAGVQTATHAIGDAAVRHVLDTLAGAARPPSGRHRIEHIETLPDDQVSRFRQLDVVASMQPRHATDFTNADHSDNWSQRLGAARADRGWRYRDLLDARATLVLGSDWPVAPFDPRAVMAAAQTRRPVHRDGVPVGPNQRLTAAEALAGYTVASAVAAGEQSRAGRLAPGHRADLTVFAGDPLTLPPGDLVDVPVLATVMAGRVRHRASD